MQFPLKTFCFNNNFVNIASEGFSNPYKTSILQKKKTFDFIYVCIYDPNVVYIKVLSLIFSLRTIKTI